MKEDGRRHSFGRVAGSIVAGVFIAALFALAIGALVMVLWNWLMPLIFGLGPITYWHGFGLVLLAKLLFGGIGHKGWGHEKNRDPGAYWHGRRKYWKSEGRGPERNKRFDDVYEDWWETEGAAGFEAYIKKKAPGGDSKKDEAEKDE
jgi:hypothetical protein